MEWRDGQVTPHNLERVRRIKSRMVRLNTRGETIREVLEKFLDDDDDMKDMNLSAKCASPFPPHVSSCCAMHLLHSGHL